MEPTVQTNVTVIPRSGSYRPIEIVLTDLSSLGEIDLNDAFGSAGVLPNSTG